MSSTARIRILLVKSGLDYHDRGVRYIARKFREAGMEVIYFQYRVVPEVVKVAIEEDVDIIGLSSSVGGYMADIDVPGLREMGVGAICGPGDSADEAVEWVKNQVATANRA